MKQRTRFSGLVAFLCLMATTALAQSYTIRFVKGTDRIDRQDSRTVGNLGELVSRLSDCKHQLEKGRYVVGLTAFQNVVDRYDPAAKSLSLAQAAALQEYLTDVCCLNDSAPFDLSVDARTDLDNRVIVELRKQPAKTDRQSDVPTPSQEEPEPFRKKETQASTSERKEAQTVVQAEKPAASSVSLTNTNRFLLGNIGLGVKTNVLLLAGLLPDGSMYSPVVNVAAEVYFRERFSAQLSFAYAMPYHKGDKNDLFSVTGFVVEPRWWLRGDGSFRGLYAGVYGQYGSFDVRIKEELEDNCTGSFYGGGISAGWLQPVWRGFYAEASVRVGYRSDEVDVYSYTVGSPYKKEASYTLNSFTLQGFSLSVGYRF